MVKKTFIIWIDADNFDTIDFQCCRIIEVETQKAAHQKVVEIGDELFGRFSSAILPDNVLVIWDRDLSMWTLEYNIIMSESILAEPTFSLSLFSVTVANMEDFRQFIDFVSDGYDRESIFMKVKEHYEG